MTLDKTSSLSLRPLREGHDPTPTIAPRLRRCCDTGVVSQQTDKPKARDLNDQIRVTMWSVFRAEPGALAEHDRQAEGTDANRSDGGRVGQGGRSRWAAGR